MNEDLREELARHAMEVEADDSLLGRVDALTGRRARRRRARRAAGAVLALGMLGVTTVEVTGALRDRPGITPLRGTGTLAESTTPVPSPSPLGVAATPRATPVGPTTQAGIPADDKPVGGVFDADASATGRPQHTVAWLTTGGPGTAGAPAPLRLCFGVLDVATERIAFRYSLGVRQVGEKAGSEQQPGLHLSFAGIDPVTGVRDTVGWVVGDIDRVNVTVNGTTHPAHLWTWPQNPLLHVFIADYGNPGSNVVASGPTGEPIYVATSR